MSKLRPAPTVKTQDPLVREHLPHAASVAAELRAAMGLCRLTPAQRTQYRGRWFLGASDFADRAAAVRDNHPGLLDEIPITSADIQAQRQRVAYLEAGAVIFTRLAREIADTLMKERATLYTMGMAIRTFVGSLHADPFRAVAHKGALECSVALLDKEFQRRQRKSAKTRRASNLRARQKAQLQGAGEPASGSAQAGEGAGAAIALPRSEGSPRPEGRARLAVAAPRSTGLREPAQGRRPPRR